MTANKPSPFVPKVRFPEFQRVGDWKREQIGNVASIIKGKGLSKADITEGGATPCIRYAELYTHYGEVIHEVVSRTNVPHEDLMLSQAEDVIIPASGETRADIAKAACVLLERVALGSDLNILRSDLYGPFFSYLLNSPLRHTIAQMAQGDTVAHLYPGQLSLVWLAYPLRPEQKKIADCLGSLDDLIEAEGRKLEALRQHKQGLMQQLVPQPGETVPRLRFPEFHNASEWKTKNLEELILVQSGGTPPKDNSEYWNGSIPWVSAKDMKRLYLEDTEDHISIAAVDNGARLVPAGTLLMLTRGMTLHKNVPICVLQREMSFNQDVKALLPKAGVKGLFLVFALLANKQRLLNMVDIAGHGTGKLNTYELEAFELAFPQPAEQQRIATCLASLEDVLAAQAGKIDALKQQKQGLLQHLFPSLETE